MSMIEITEEDFDKYIAECEDFYLVGDPDPIAMYYREADDELFALKDSAGRCFSRTQYWSIQ